MKALHTITHAGGHGDQMLVDWSDPAQVDAFIAAAHNAIQHGATVTARAMPNQEA